MNKFKKGDILRLDSGEICKVINIPGTFMSNGSYEVLIVEAKLDGQFIDTKEKQWVKPSSIAYSVTTSDHNDPITNYFETFYDGNGEIQIIPKGLTSVELVEENGFKTIRLMYENHIHGAINILIGENEIKNGNK